MLLLVTPVEELSGTSHKKLEQVGMRQKQIQIASKTKKSILCGQRMTLIEIQWFWIAC